jgi:hypothetical protein
MNYPEDFTADDIMEFEYEWERYCDLADPYSLASINAECAAVAEQQREAELIDSLALLTV